MCVIRLYSFAPIIIIIQTRLMKMNLPNMRADDAGLCNDCAAAAGDDVLGVAATTSLQSQSLNDNNKKGAVGFFLDAQGGA